MLYKKKFLLILLFIFTNVSISGTVSTPLLKDCHNMIKIPAGSFMMGSKNGSNDELPVHKVYVDSFWICKAEVTIFEYLECVKEGIVSMPDWWNTKYFQENIHDNDEPDWLNFPVTGVSWQDAVKFCKWKGKGYRLPTEAEWEYTARAGSKKEYLWGDKSAGGDIFDNYDSTAMKYANIEGGLKAIMSTQPNNWGLYDMTGNVWEWCLDSYRKDYYQTSLQNNPQGPTPRSGPDLKSVRGGSWKEYSFNLRLANRSYGEANKGYKGVGFRMIYKNSSD